MMTDLDDFEMEHYKTSVTKNSLTFLLEGIDPRDLASDGLSLLDFESGSEAGGVREEPTCQELAIEGECLTKQGEYREAIPMLESALKLGSGDPQLLSVLWSLLGNAHFYMGEYEKAAQCHEHDLSICNELGDERNQAQAYCNLGIANRKTGYLKRAKLCYEKYLDICEKIEDSRSKSKANHNLGDLHLTLARLKLQRDKKLEESPEAKEHLEMAVKYFKKHLEYVQEIHNKSAEARIHASLGYVYELLQDTDKAIDHYQQRLKLAVEMTDKGAEGRSYCSIGNCLRAIIQPEKALECYNRGLSIAEELEDKTGVGVIHSNMGMAFEMLNKLEQSVEQHEKHLEAMESTENVYGQAMALDNIARTYEYMATLGKACETLEKLLAVQKNLQKEAAGGSEVADTQARLDRLAELAGTSKTSTATSGGGGGGLKNTWKKLKGRRKKQRNLTAPEINTRALKKFTEESAGSTQLAPLREDSQRGGGGGDDGGAGKEKSKGVFGKKSQSKEKVKVEVKKQDSKQQPSVKTSPVRRSSSVGNKNEVKNLRVESPRISASLEDTSSFSQRSDSRYSDDYLREKTTTTLNLNKASSKSGEITLTEQADLSQTSTRLSLSQSGTFTGTEEHPSTPSSIDNAPLTLPGSSSTSQNENKIHAEEITNGFIPTSDQLSDHEERGHEERGHEERSEKETEVRHLSSDSQTNAPQKERETEQQQSSDVSNDHQDHDGGGSLTSLYTQFGDKQHRMNLQHVREFLQSAEEDTPWDLTLLMDWDGWMLASRDIVLPTSKESQLI